jgi:hypothetical protein
MIWIYLHDSSKRHDLHGRDNLQQACGQAFSRQKLLILAIYGTWLIFNRKLVFGWYPPRKHAWECSRSYISAKLAARFHFTEKPVEYDGLCDVE